MITPEFKAKWIAALRSDEYTQARETLGSGKHLCCIGVGVNVAGLERGEGWYIGRGAFDKLVAMNDREMKSFAEIADWIEVNL